MPINWSGWKAEVEAKVAATWPETRKTNVPPGGGIFWLNTVEHTSVDRIVNLPYAAAARAPIASADWGLTNSAFEVRLTLHYVAKQSLGEEGLLEKLDLLRAALLAVGSLTTATVLDCEELTVHEGEEGEAVWIAKNLPVISGKVVLTCVIGETIG